MATINRARVAWTNFSGAPGLSTFYFGSSTVDMTALRAFFNAFTLLIPSGVTIAVPSAGDQINDTTGQITGIWTGPAQSSFNCSGGTGAYAGGSGAVCEWLSSAIVAGRRPIGKTFLVPLISGQFDSNGSLSAGCITAIQTAAATLITAYAGEMKVFSRPYVPPVGSPNPPRVGVASTIVAARVPDLAAVLRSRRT